jgi:hypothetical protein
MALAIGPCMFLAPLVFVLALLMIPLWPVAIILAGVIWLVVWPIDQLLVLAGVRSAGGASRRVNRWLRVAVTPWTLFALPKRVPSPGAPPDTPSPTTPSPDQPPRDLGGAG